MIRRRRNEPHLDTYTVEFPISKPGAILDEPQLQMMASWMERCHLDTLRPPGSALPRDEDEAARARAMRAAAARNGECLVLEDLRTEAAVPVGVFFATLPETPGLAPAVATHLPSQQAIEATIAATPLPTPIAVTPPIRGSFSGPRMTVGSSRVL